MDKEEYVLMMPLIETLEKQPKFYASSEMDAAINFVPITYEALVGFTNTFAGFELDNIEVHVKGIVKSGGLTQFIVGLEGEAGVKLTLKRKNN
jgi:hypothetical protein